MLEETLSKIKEVKEKADAEEETVAMVCPHCGSHKTVRNGHKNNKQSYLCGDCKKSFVQTTKAAIQGSHSRPTVWKQVISDTVHAGQRHLKCSKENISKKVIIECSPEHFPFGSKSFFRDACFSQKTQSCFP